MYLAGHHSAFYATNASSASYNIIGSSRNGIDMIVTAHDDPVTDDAFGMAQPDSINQGNDTVLSLDWIEYDAIAGALFQQIGSVGTNTITPEQINNFVGHTLTSLSGSLLVVPVAGTPAATQLGVGKGHFFPVALVVSDFRILMASKLRQGPCTFRCFPGSNGISHSIVTASSYVGSATLNPTGPSTLTPYYSGF